ncbi:MAG TPA: GlsB/YeaQ/YmgE family stress response membrane protein, partial [Aggregatilineaceae bacterium]|nr:GlsB/YeaQ/YmgE family stress response membrane protein [Aggregatilineaceae bacterium]
TITIDAHFVALLIVGLVAGTAAAIVFERGVSARSKWLRNLVIGIVGAFLGKLIFDALNLSDKIPSVLTGTITTADILIAFVGASILILIARRIP